MVQTALEETRFDKMLLWLGSYAAFRNDGKAVIDNRLIQKLLFSITGAIKLLADIGNRDLIEEFREKYVAVKLEKAAIKKSSYRGLLTTSENTFFDQQLHRSTQKRQIHEICDQYEKEGGDIDRAAAKIKTIKGVRLSSVIPALLNLRKNHLVAEIKEFGSLDTATPTHFEKLAVKFTELEELIGDDRVNATEQAIKNLTPVYLRVLERIFKNPEYTVEEREKALNHAFERVAQKKAYANFQISTIYEMILQAIQAQDKDLMESHLSFYKQVMENNFKVFRKSMAQIKREIDEITRAYQHREMGLS